MKVSDKRYKLGTVITASLLVGFLGFALGFNYPILRDKMYSRVYKPQAGLPAQLDFSSVQDTYNALRKNYAGELDAENLIEGAKEGLVKAAGDPHSEYLNKEQAKEFNEGLSGSFSGIGAEIAVKNNNLMVVAPLEGSPAKAAGIRAGDTIIKINDEDTTDMSVGTAVSKIRGPSGSQVKLQIAQGNNEPKEITITRANIEVPSVESELKNGDIGYIKVSRFGEDTVSKVREAASRLKSQGATKIILDLRNNPGGLLEAAVDLSDEFLDAGKIVEERKDGTVLATQIASSGGELVGLPTIVLINEGSASASEIVAGALQDNKKATVVGMKSFGKGSVQELIKLGNNGLLKVTVATWYTPKGKNINKEGITPDMVVDLNQDDFNNNRDPQLNKAIEILNSR